MSKIKQSGPSLIVVALIGAIAGYLIRGNELPLAESSWRGSGPEENPNRRPNRPKTHETAEKVG
jgi:hypothetical protein